MAVNEEVLLDVKVQDQDALNNIAKLTQANSELKAQLAAVKKEYADGNVSQADYAKQAAVINAQIKENTAGIRENSKEIKANAASVASASDSVNGMRARIADLTAVWNSLSKEAREGSAGKNIQKELLSLNESVNASNKSIGNFKNNIGNYPTAQLGTLPGIFGEIQGKATSAFEAIKGKLEDGKNLQIAYKSSLEKASEAQAEAKRLSLEAAKAEEILTIAKKSGTATSEMQATAEAARAAATKAATVATEASAAAMKILKIAIASTGIGILVVALGSLVAYFTKTNEGAKKFQQVMNGVNAVIQSGVKIMGSLGKLVFDVLTGNVKELSKDFDSVKNNIKGATTEISKNYEAAERNTKNRQMMAKREREWSGQRLVLLKEYEDARIMASKKSSLDDAGKIAAAKRALAINNEIYANDLKIAKNKSIMVENEQKLVSKKDYQAIQDSKNKVQEIINAHSQQQLTISNLLGKAEQREEASNRASVKSNEQKLKEKQDQEIKSAEDLLKLKKQNQKDIDQTMLIDAKYFDERLSLLSQNAEDEKKIIDLKLKYHKISTEEAKIATQNADKEAASGKLALQKQQADQLIKELDYELQLNKANNAELLAGKKLTDKQIHDNKLSELQKQYEDELQKLSIKFDSEEIGQDELNKQIALKNAEKNAAIAQENADFDKAESERHIQAQADNYANELSLLNENGDRAIEIKKAQLDAQMAVEIAAAQKNGASVELIQQKYARNKKMIDKQAADARLDQEKRIADGVANLFGKTTKAGKIAASASTAIDTYKGAQAAIAGMAGAGPVGWALGAIEAGVIIANGVKTIAQINKTSETGESSVGTGSTESASAASGGSATTYTNLPTLSGLYSSNAQQNETAQTIAASTPTPVVKVTEITDMQNTVKVKENSKL